ncbi:hypothetical protein EGW08_015201 [Elysia chlorotica]|uniref:Guanylate cyclase domain-containing protein n=1 Tax=Elysia chlorotica TaxID=188477 RepID=A0A3S1B648_ELYCH|nr:hypothetical protein EGW08_015201 [Elysia chlorotica]
MIWLHDTKHMIFIGSPRLTSLNELIEMNVYLADIPLYDVTRELVLLNQQRIAEIDIADIVTFTNIAAACSPMDIVNMLNEMYQRFDELTSQHKVYKVETIGDAYMIVSGVPETTRVHAQLVANFAMDMVEEAGLVKSPATALPLQDREELDVKGKGKMATYFLCGHLKRRMEELDDDFAALEVYEDSTENGQYVVGPSGLSQDDLVSLDVNGDKAVGDNNTKTDAVDTTFDDDDDDVVYRDDDDDVKDNGGISGEDDEDEEDNADADVERLDEGSCDEEDLHSDHTVDEKVDEVEKCQEKKRRESECLVSINEKVEPARRKISSQSLASGSKQANAAPKLKRGNRKMSRSCNDTAFYSATLTLPHHKGNGHRSASENEIVTNEKTPGRRSGSKTNVGEGGDSECIYVNGSFKNTYRSSMYKGDENSVEFQPAVQFQRTKRYPIATDPPK